MAVTLSEAKAFLAPYVDNGIYPGDDRVIARINEAQRRLHSYSAWLGVMAKYAVNVTGSQFTLPDYTGNLTTFAGFGLESATRIAETSANVGFMTNSVQAFVADSTSLVQLQFAPTSSDLRTFQLIGDSINVPRVEITGKLNYQPAVNDNDLLIIQDLDALKLMVLALWREQGGQLDVAKAFLDQAIERLTIKTDRAVEAARRVNFQTQVYSSIPYSLGEFRARMALDLTDGVKISDAEMVNLINDSEESLFALGKWYGTVERYRFNVTQTNEILIPSDIGTILFASMDTNPVNIFDRNFDFHENGPGYNTRDSDGWNVLIDRGEVYANNAWHRKYFIRDATAPECIEVLAKKRWKSKNQDSDLMDIRNYQAIKEMAFSLQAAKDKPEVAAYHEQKAINILKKELSEMRGGARATVRVQAEGFAAGEITALI
jgi:aryl carrier-like protein